MVISCCAFGCTNRQGKKGVKFYRFPANEDQKQKWISAIKRDKWSPNEYSRLCSVHFISGKMSKDPYHPDYVPTLFVYALTQTQQPCWSARHLRSVSRHIKKSCSSTDNPCRDKPVTLTTTPVLPVSALPMSVSEVDEFNEVFGSSDSDEDDGERDEQIYGSSNIQVGGQLESSVTSESDGENGIMLKNTEAMKTFDDEQEQNTSRDDGNAQAMEIGGGLQFNTSDDGAEGDENFSDNDSLLNTTNDENVGDDNVEVNHGLELECAEIEIGELQIEVCQLRNENEELKLENDALRQKVDILLKQLEVSNSAHQDAESSLLKEVDTLNLQLHYSKHSQDVMFGAKFIKDDNDKTYFYTGLPTYALFVALYTLLQPCLPSGSNRFLSLLDELFLVLVKLRLGVPHKDLAYRAGVTEAYVSAIFHKWIDLMSRELQCLIAWPDEECLRENMPSSFRNGFSNTKCIIDCFEIFIQRPVFFPARAATYSNYKKHNTVKVLIGISPTGSISFLSKAWGGRVSDKVITQRSGFLNHIIPGDVILADRGFNIEDDLAVLGAYLKIPAFTKGKAQLSQYDVEKSRKLARVRIHVERLIGHLRQKYKILSETLPISLIKCPSDQNRSNCTIDRILIVTAALTNLSQSVVTS